MIRYASCVWEPPMPTTFRAYQPDQPLLLPPDLQEWVPPGHLAHHVSDVVDALDLTAFYAPYEGDGRRNAPYEPSMMVKVLIGCESRMAVMAAAWFVEFRQRLPWLLHVDGCCRWPVCRLR